MHFSLTNDQKVTIAELASTTITDACDLSVRMEFINDDSSDIAEIPRFTVEEKVGIQLEFLSYALEWHFKA